MKTKNTMKYRVVVTMLLAVALVLTGCEGNDHDAGSNGDVSSGTYDFTVGLTATMPHPAMEDAGYGFRTELTRLMAEAGYTVNFLYQNADGVAADMSSNATTLVSQGVDLLFGLGTGAAVAARDVSYNAGLPLIFSAVNDPVAVGLNMPHVTGSSNLLNPVDQMNFVREVMGLADGETVRIAYLYYTAEDNSRILAHGVDDAFSGSTETDVTLFPFNSLEELTPQFTALRAGNFDVIYVGLDNLLITHRAQLRTLNEQGTPLPMVGAINAMADMEGGMVAGLSVNFVERGRVAAAQAFEVLVNGAEPGSVGINFPTDATLEVKVNLERARLIGFTLPENLIERADVVVETTE